jgi:predicted PurR-regulated permease PerM
MLFLGYLILQPFIGVILFSILIVVVVGPVHERIKPKFKKNLSASMFSTFLIFLFVLIPLSIFTIIFINQLLDLYPVILSKLEKIHDLNSYIEKFQSYQWFQKKILTKLHITNYNDKFTDIFKDQISGILNFTVEKGKNLLFNVGIFLLGLFLVLATIFFLLLDGNRLYNWVYNLIPLTEREKTYLVSSSIEAIKATFIGTVMTAAAQAMLGFIAYVAIGINFSFFFASLTFVASFIPVGGAALIWVPVGIYTFFMHGIIAGIIFLLYGVFVITIICDNFVRPIVIGNRVDIHPLLLIFAIFGGIEIFGFLGIFLAPIIMILIDNLAVIYTERFSNQVIINAFDDQPPAISEEEYENKGF